MQKIKNQADGQTYPILFCSLYFNVIAEKIMTSVLICQSYHKKLKVAFFLGHDVVYYCLLWLLAHSIQLRHCYDAHLKTVFEQRGIPMKNS